MGGRSCAVASGNSRFGTFPAGLSSPIRSFLPEAGEFDGPILSPNGRLLAVMREVKRKTVWEMKYRSLISLWDIERLRAKVTVPKNP
jgi:hypothetical protein